MVSKKFFAKAFAFAMVTGLLTVAAPAMGKVWANGTVQEPSTSKNEVKPVAVEVKYEEMYVIIKPGNDDAEESNNDNYVFLEVMKKADDPADKQGTVYTFPVPVNGEPVKVDLSFLKITKASYLRVWGDKSKTQVKVTINAQPPKIKFKYTAQTFPELSGEIPITTADQTALEKYYADSFGITDKTLSYGVRTLYGHAGFGLKSEDGKKLVPTTDGDVLANLKVTGTTLVIWQMAKDDIQDDGTNKGYPAGPEAKVKIPAAPKAPKVTIDYAKGTIKLPKNAQYGIIEDGDLVYVTAPEKGGAITPEDILKEIANELKIGEEDGATADEKVAAKAEFVDDRLAAGFDLVVRTNDAKKGASNPAFVPVKKTVTYYDDRWGKIKVDDTEEAAEIATYEFSDAGVTVTFGSGSFEYEESDKWKKISSGKLIKGKTSELTIRMAGVKDKDETKTSFPSTEMKIKKPVDNSKVVVKGAGDKNSVVKGAELEVTIDTATGNLKDRENENKTESNIKKVDWKSSDTSVASVEPVTGSKTKATVTGKGKGKCTITVIVTFDNDTTATGTIEITVDEPTT